MEEVNISMMIVFTGSTDPVGEMTNTPKREMKEGANLGEQPASH